MASSDDIWDMQWYATPTVVEGQTVYFEVPKFEYVEKIVEIPQIRYVQKHVEIVQPAESSSNDGLIERIVMERMAGDRVERYSTYEKSMTPKREVLNEKFVELMERGELRAMAIEDQIAQLVWNHSTGCTLNNMGIQTEIADNMALPITKFNAKLQEPYEKFPGTQGEHDIKALHEAFESLGIQLLTSEKEYLKQTATHPDFQGVSLTTLLLWLWRK
eukprot:gnl/MRDRNA2_/MRDRNA2_251111_c0_seq1.p1 gnl/MRDRNA2_/MRDRNA2_251111_c0~~gnl/MRDRNA2_/MRDRNA2_251111_c0_seq1.p1  ORF type:complete len:217 (+),score=39.21 gnl/MRDRNA2_/MRDRNA2_251111_c0_seq1:406-1056(+)